MHGTNPIRTPVKGDGDTLEVQEIFATFQGEGPHTGTPAIFIRLGGCNLACHFCDTEFESFSEWNVKDIVAEVTKLAGKTHRLAVITGGEPFRQPIEQLCTKLLDADFHVQIETNGTLYRPVDARVDIVCSPKHTGRCYAPVRDDLLKHTTALKFIVSANDSAYHTVAEVGQSAHNIPVYVQPMDEYDDTKNAANISHANALAQKYGYRLSLQLHKIVGVK